MPHSTLFTPAPSFDQPIAVLKHCHDKIRRQLSTLQKLSVHLAEHGADHDAREAAANVLGYFDKAAPLHHADEENNLLPMLDGCAQGDDKAQLAALAPRILEQHREMETLWARLRLALQAIAEGGASTLPEADAARFSSLYLDHMTQEESVIAPMAKRLFTPAQMAELGHAMQVRRGIIEDPTPPDSRADVIPGLPPQSALADLRTDYKLAALLEADVLPDPIAQFAAWFAEALDAKVNEPNAMTLATVDLDNKPSARIVLIKDFDDRGFTWFTNYDSRKGHELAHNPHASLLFFWSELERQVRIEGTVEKVEAAESDAYFQKRPLQSRLAAIASEQSQTIASREEMERKFAAVAAANGEHPARPVHWGGYRLKPERLEFWQGRRSRFHDRIVYVRGADGTWTRERLQP
ncbi:MAG TPA: pyridoxamine 5'-phosphate oxidase [Burkholderiaceae bacterium]